MMMSRKTLLAFFIGLVLVLVWWTVYENLVASTLYNHFFARSEVYDKLVEAAIQLSLGNSNSSLVEEWVDYYRVAENANRTLLRLDLKAKHGFEELGITIVPGEGIIKSWDFGISGLGNGVFFIVHLVMVLGPVMLLITAWLRWAFLHSQEEDGV